MLARRSNVDLGDKLCPKCLLRTHVLAPSIRETSSPKGTEHSSPDVSSSHTMGTCAQQLEVRKLMHRGHGSLQMAGTCGHRLQGLTATKYCSRSVRLRGEHGHRWCDRGSE